MLPDLPPRIPHPHLLITDLPVIIPSLPNPIRPAAHLSHRTLRQPPNNLFSIRRHPLRRIPLRSQKQHDLPTRLLVRDIPREQHPHHRPKFAEPPRIHVAEENRPVHETGIDVREANFAGVLLGERFEGESLHEDGVMAHGSDAVRGWRWRSDGEGVGRGAALHAAGENGDHVCGLGCGKEEGSEGLNEADAGVVEQRHLGVDAFFGGWVGY